MTPNNNDKNSNRGLALAGEETREGGKNKWRSST